MNDILNNSYRCNLYATLHRATYLKDSKETSFVVFWRKTLGLIFTVRELLCNLDVTISACSFMGKKSCLFVGKFHTSINEPER